MPQKETVWRKFSGLQSGNRVGASYICEIIDKFHDTSCANLTPTSPCRSQTDVHDGKGTIKSKGDGEQSIDSLTIQSLHKFTPCAVKTKKW